MAHYNLKNATTFLKHLPFETAESLTDSKYIASDRAEAGRYKYRANAVLAGDALVKVGQLIYLEGLEHGMSGYWTVLSLTHVFGQGNAGYQLDVELGTDVPGNTSNNVAEPFIRDFSTELANQSLDSGESTLNNYSFGVNDGKVESSATYPKSSKVVAKPYAEPAATAYTPNIYVSETPDFSKVKRTIKWVAK